MTDLSSLYDEYMVAVQHYQALIPLGQEDYFILFKRGVRRMYIDTGRPDQYKGSWLRSPNDLNVFPADVGEDEQEYILICAQLAFYNQMASDMSAPNQITQHKTDALTVTFSDKGFANLNSKLADLEQERTDVYHKMPQFARGVGC